jgi:hypothetical protein
VERTNQADDDSEVILRVMALKSAVQTSIRHRNIASILDVYRHARVNWKPRAAARWHVVVSDWRLPFVKHKEHGSDDAQKPDHIVPLQLFPQIEH